MKIRRLPAFFRTTTFRLALVHAALFILFSAALLVYLYVRTAGRLESAAQEELLTEVRAAIESHTKGGFEGLNQTIIERPSSSPFYYLLLDENGAKVSGDFNTLPAEAPLIGQANVKFEYEARTFQGQLQSQQARGRMVRFQDGSVLMVARDLGEREAIVTLVTNTVWQSAIIGLALSFLGGILVSRSAAQRVDALARTTQDVMSGDLSRRAPVIGSGDEFDRLAERINAMLSRLERLMTGARHAGDAIAHDLRTPLARLRNRLEATLANNHDGNAWKEAVESSLVEVDHVLDTCSAILRLSHVQGGQTGKLQRIDVSDLMDELAEFYEPVSEDKQLSLSSDIRRNLIINADRSLITQAMVNLIENAMKYSPVDGKVMITAKRRQGEIELSVIDNGYGIPEAERKKVVERFYRVQSARTEPGTGLGLALVVAVADMHQGRFVLGDGEASQHGSGLSATLVLKAA